MSETNAIKRPWRHADAQKCKSRRHSAFQFHFTRANKSNSECKIRRGNAITAKQNITQVIELSIIKCRWKTHACCRTLNGRRARTT